MESMSVLSTPEHLWYSAFAPPRCSAAAVAFLGLSKYISGLFKTWTKDEQKRAPVSVPAASSLRGWGPNNPEQCVGDLTHDSVVTSACSTCKIRRVRCDGIRPFCKRCTDTGRKCDGYPFETSIIPGQQIDPREVRSVQYFRERTALELCSYYDEDFWRYRATQLANSHSEVWHIMVAIGSLHESLKQQTWTQNAPSLKPKEPSFALQQCNKAIGLLIGANANAPRTVLMLTCILFFMAFDLMQNKVDSSISHLQHAWSILNVYRSEKRNYATCSEISLIEEHLLPIIIRFSESWSLHRPGPATLFSAITEDVKATTHWQTLPQSFMSLNQAQSSLHHILDGLDVPPPTDCYSEVKMTPTSKAPAISILAVWGERYQHFIDSLCSREFCPAMRRRLTLLELHYTTAKLLCEMRSVKNEMVYDTKLETFQSIVQQCEKVLRIEREIAATSEPKMAVCFDLGITVPLYLTASRCRHPGTRREALRLLTSFPRREGIWLSWVIGLVAQQVIDIEEDGLQDPQFCEDVALKNRIEVLGVHYNPCSLKDLTGQDFYAPVLQLTWMSAAAFRNANWVTKDMKHKTIQLPKTRDDSPGSRPYWVIIPRDGQMSSPKLLLGKKTCVPPPLLVPENVDVESNALNITSYPTPATRVTSRTSDGSSSSTDIVNRP